MLISQAVAAKLAAGLTVVTISGATYTATRPPSPDPLVRTQQQQKLYGEQRKGKLKGDRRDLRRQFDADRANRLIPSQRPPAGPRIPRILRLLRFVRVR